MQEGGEIGRKNVQLSPHYYDLPLNSFTSTDRHAANEEEEEEEEMATSYVPLPAGLPLKQEKPGSSTQWSRCTRAPRGTALAPFEDQSG